MNGPSKRSGKLLLGKNIFCVAHQRVQTHSCYLQGSRKERVLNKMISACLLTHLLKACVPEYSLIASAIASYS